MYASLSSKNLCICKINRHMLPHTSISLNFKFSVSKLRKVTLKTNSICLNFKLWNQKTCSCNCPASVSCYSKLHTLELCCYKESTTSVRYMVQLAMHWKKHHATILNLLNLGITPLTFNLVLLAFKVSRPALLYKRLASWEDTWSWQKSGGFRWMFCLHACKIPLLGHIWIS